jgi:hypothetical protein
MREFVQIDVSNDSTEQRMTEFTQIDISSNVTEKNVTFCSEFFWCIKCLFIYPFVFGMIANILFQFYTIIKCLTGLFEEHKNNDDLIIIIVVAHNLMYIFLLGKNHMINDFCKTKDCILIIFVIIFALVLNITTVIFFANKMTYKIFKCFLFFTHPVFMMGIDLWVDSQ